MGCDRNLPFCSSPVADERCCAIILLMDDVVFFALAETIVGYVDELYGRIAAWLAAFAMLALLVVLIAALIWWIAQ